MVTYGSRLRRAAFWTLDGLRGSPVRDHVHDIRARMEGGMGGDDRLRPLLEHAIETTRFYAPIARPEIDAFPVIDRAMYLQRRAEFESSAFAGKALHRVSTSGTSGMRLTVAQDPDKRRRSIADTIYVNGALGLPLGDRLLWLRAWRSREMKPWLVRLAQNIEPFDVRGLDEKAREDLVDVLRRRRIHGVIGYTSAMSSLARHIEERGYDAHAFGLRLIINDSETLHPHLKGHLEAVFGCPVEDRYANAENGILAATVSGDGRLVLNRASYWFEFLKLDSDEPQAPGRPARVVVTDLFNHAMPIIRYDIGDVVIVADHDGPRAVALESVEGRYGDTIWDTAGREVSVMVMGAAMWHFREAPQYRLTQNGRLDYELRVTGARGIYTTEQLTAGMQDLLGPDALITVMFVDRIPADESGKSRPLMCNYRPDEPRSDQD